MLITKDNINKTEIDPSHVWEKLEDFSKYGFNKSHAIAYSIIGYQTAKIWAYHRDEFLEYMLNYDTKERYQQAMDKCKELNFKFEYPTIYNMANDKFKVKNNTVYVPGYAENNYESYVDFLFGDGESNIYNLIYKGVCDSLTRDRTALVELISTLLSKPKQTAKYMEPSGEKFTRLSQILDGLKMAGAVVDWKKNEDGCIHVFVKRSRGTPNEVIFHPNSSDEVKRDIVKLDLKMFGAVRDGVISDLPYINTTGIERTLTNLKNKYYEKGQGKYAFRAMQDKLKEYMMEYFSNPFRNTFHDVYAILDDHIAFDRSTKLKLTFNDRQEILYATGQNMKVVKAIPKKALVKMTLIYSPFISRRKEEFVYDFDIESIEWIQ